jgi:hypothetical protein
MHREEQEFAAEREHDEWVAEALFSECRIPSPRNRWSGNLPALKNRPAMSATIQSNRAITGDAM